jgi:hypothetical protein
MRTTKYCCYSILCATLCGTPAWASSISFTGMFSADNQMAIFSFVASASSPVIRTLSYNGGTNANSQSIPPGGFVTALSLFGPDTMLMFSTPLIGEDGNGTGDSLINTSSPPIAIVNGLKYWVVLTEWDNLPNGATFGSGFSESGNGNFTSTFGCGSGPFCDPNTLTIRDGNWAVDITGVTSAQQEPSAVPEPATFLMLGTVLAGLWGSRRLKSAARQSLD